MAEWLKVAKTNDIAPGDAKVVYVGAWRVAIFNIDGTYHAIDDTCTHRGGPLSEGIVEGIEVTCPWHGDFDLKTGAVMGPPANKGVSSCKVVVENDDIKVEV